MPFVTRLLSMAYKGRKKRLKNAYYHAYFCSFAIIFHYRFFALVTQ